MPLRRWRTRSAPKGEYPVRRALRGGPKRILECFAKRFVKDASVDVKQNAQILAVNRQKVGGRRRVNQSCGRSAPRVAQRAGGDTPERENRDDCVSQGIGMTSQIESLPIDRCSSLVRARTHSRGYDVCGLRGTRAVPVSARVSADTFPLAFLTSDLLF